MQRVPIPSHGTRGTGMLRDARAPAGVPAVEGVEGQGDQGNTWYPELDGAMGRFADGDDTAFVALHAGLGPRMHRLLLRLTGDRALSADLVQESFLRIHRGRGGFVHGAAVVPWALAIARNVFRDDLRRRKRTIAAGHEGEASLLAAYAADGTAEEIALAREAGDVVRVVLAALPVAQREAFVMMRFEALPLDEIAEILDTTPTAVKLRAFRAGEAIREALRKREDR